MNKHRVASRERRRLRREKAFGWVRNDYVALKTYARMMGFYDRIRWHEFEAMPAIQMVNKRRLLEYWCKCAEEGSCPQYLHFTFSPNTKEPPSDWLNWRWMKHIKETSK